MEKKYKFRILCMALIVMVLLCGARKRDFVFLDPEKYIMYKNVTVDTVMQDYNNDEKNFASKYDGQYLAISGKIDNISDKNKSFTVISLNENYDKAIECTIKDKDKTLIKQFGELKNGTIIKVYGVVSVSSIKKNIKLKISKVESINNIIYSDNLYTSINGFDYDINNMVEEKINNGSIKYLIPQEWTSVKKELENEKLSGFQYNLNEINRATAKVESLFIFYFDNEKCLKNPNDKEKKAEKIQVAIINNILEPKKEASETERKFTRENSKTYYGSTYNYYCDTYTSSSNQQTYRVEFVFETIDTDGILVYLYVFNSENEKKHIDDIMMVMKSAEW